MRNIIQIKSAKAVDVGDYVLVPQFSTGILLANKVSSVEVIDDGKWMEIGTMNEEGKKKRLFVVKAEDKVVVAI